jgi:tRNA-splicing ligase RtcB
MSIKTVLTQGNVPVKIWTDDIDEKAKIQLSNIATLPFVHKHIAAMPDVHMGIGATIGSVIACRQAIIPAAVGVDIGCGMIACRLSLSANDIDDKSLKSVFDQISHDVPVGRDQHKEDNALTHRALPFKAALMQLTQKHPTLLKTFKNFSSWICQLGTLGSGNHFIELCLDEETTSLDYVAFGQSRHW